MNFSEQLNKYIELIHCTSKELAHNSGLSYTVISRYRNNNRIPHHDSKQLEKLINGLIILANERDINVSKIHEDFNKSLNDNSIDFELFRNNLNELISVLNISISEMSRYLSFDASYLSRIRTGKRIPSDIKGFSSSICNYIVHRYNNSNDKKVISDIIGCNINDIREEFNYLSKLNAWLSSNAKINTGYVGDFLKKLDEFDLNEYIRLIKFDKLKVPTIPFKLPKSKNYYGVEAMKNGELDFLKATVLSKNTESVFMCSDMPMEDMAKDVEFGKKWMFGIAMMLKKGLHLDIIHNIDRPFKEMMIGLESWIPIYMTGQISPYYLKNVQNNAYCHFNYVSGSSALTGECINGFHNNGKYYLTNKEEEVSYYKQKSKNLISKAYPLIEIYRKESKNTFNSFINSDINNKGDRHNILSSLPIYTISDKLLIEMLNNNNLNDIEINEITEFVKKQKEITKNILSHSNILDEITEISKSEFDNYPISLSLSSDFYEKKVTYTYEEYLNHLKGTKNYSKTNENYSIKINPRSAFRNIQISIRDGKWVILSKDTNPTIHFVIRHPKLCDAIKNFVAPVID